MWKKVSPTTLYIHKEEPFATYNPYFHLVGKPKRENIEEIIVEEGHPRLISVDNCLIDAESNRLLLVCKNSKIPANITSLGAYVYRDGFFLDTMYIPNTVKEILWGAFAHCRNLTKINIPDSVTKIGPYAFDGCCNLVELTLPNSIKTIQSNAFLGCTSLKKVILSENLTTLKKEAFAYCSSLEYVRFGGNIKFIGVGTFRECDKLTILAPAGSYAEDYAKKHNIKFEAI